MCCGAAASMSRPRAPKKGAFSKGAPGRDAEAAEAAEATQDAPPPHVSRAYAAAGPQQDAPPPLWARASPRFLLLPAALPASACVALVLGPARCAAALPDPGVWWLLGTSRRLLANGPRELLPRDRSAAFRLGALAEAVRAFAAGSDAEAAALGAATDILGAPRGVTREQLLEGVPAAAAAAAAGGGALGRLAGAFSVANVGAAVAVVGIALSLGPTLAVISRPIWRRLKVVAGVLAESLRKLLEMLLKRVVWPTREPFAWAALSYMLLAAERFRGAEGAHDQVAWLAATLALPAFAWSLQLHPPLPSPGASVAGSRVATREAEELLMGVSGLWAMSYLAPSAMVFESRTLGTAAVAALFAALGMLAVPFVGGFGVGFSSERAMDRSRLASVMLLASFYAAKAAGVLARTSLAVFQPGVATFGTIALGLAGLIDTMPRWHGGPPPAWWRRDGAYVATLLASAAAGAYFGAPAASNTAYVFLALWASQSYAVVLSRNKALLAPGVLAASTALWYATLWLKANPAFLASLFTLP